MSLLDRLFAREVPAPEIERVAHNLSRSAAPPPVKRLRCIRRSARPAAVADWMNWTLWQDKHSGEVWVRCTGGVTDVDAWFGPGDASLAGPNDVAKDLKDPPG